MSVEETSRILGVVLSERRLGKAIFGGFVVFCICAFYGWKLIARGIRNDTLDATGHEVAPRWLFIVAGVLMQVPLVAFTVFVWHQGYFE